MIGFVPGAARSADLLIAIVPPLFRSHRFHTQFALIERRAERAINPQDSGRDGGFPMIAGAITAALAACRPVGGRYPTLIPGLPGSGGLRFAPADRRLAPALFVRRPGNGPG